MTCSPGDDQPSSQRAPRPEGRQEWLPGRCGARSRCLAAGEDGSSSHVVLEEGRAVRGRYCPALGSPWHLRPAGRALRGSSSSSTCRDCEQVSASAEIPSLLFSLRNVCHHINFFWRFWKYISRKIPLQIIIYLSLCWFKCYSLCY